MVYEHLIELNELAKEEGRSYPSQRALLETIQSNQGKHFIGIVGPRGVGKTILLKQLLSKLPSSFYLSADQLDSEDLFDLAQFLKTRFDIQYLLIDEIHFYSGYTKALKKIFDFGKVRIIFTSSVSLALIASAYDLSRRVRLYTLGPFSYGQYLYFTQGVELPSLSIEDIFERRWTSEHLYYGFKFKEYLQGGLFPFALEEPDPLPLLKNTLKKVIWEDIPAVASLKVEELGLIERTVQFIGRSSIDGINYTSISKNVGITKYKAEAYVKLLCQAFVLHVTLPAGSNVMREPKVLMALPYRLLYQDYELCIGGLREDFFAETMRMKGIEFDYLKSQRGAKTPDFLVKTEQDAWVLEVGGKGKGRQRFKGIDTQKKIILADSQDTEGLKRPLFLIGY